jgi:hypothetical protein
MEPPRVRWISYDTQWSYTEKGDEYVVKTEGKWKYRVASGIGQGDAGRGFDKELGG